ncbi:MAG TPA: ATP-binding protein [Steroidobacteraceae bacterium]|nr:ATP-binding protein [Steroidobacteraceae bacterium]
MAGAAVLSISSLGLFYVWHSARAAQLDAVRTELAQLARTAATLVDGDLHRSITSQEQAGSPEHLALLAPLVKFHKAASDIIYVYTAVLDRDRIYYILGTDYLYRVAGDSEPPDLIMTPHETFDPTLRRALYRHEVAVNDEPVRERVRSYMSAYAPFFDRTGRFVGVVGIDMWVRDFDARIASIRRAGIVAFAAVALMSVLAGFVVMRLSRTAQRAKRRDRVVQLRLAEAKKNAEARAQRAQAASRAKSELLAVMSHEIRTPISGVLGFANRLLDTPLNPEQREFAETVQRSGDALLTVLNDVLDYSKMEAGRMTVEQIDMSLQSVFDRVRAILQPAALERGVVMNIEYDARLPKYIKGDPARTQQVLLNLAGNAVKFTDGGVVLISAEQLDSTHVKISVTDSGIGIADEQLATLFQSFAQADTSIARRFGGTGLGLAISKTLVELMGGEIGVHSRPGAGSTFWFVLPLHADTSAREADAPGKPAELGALNEAARPVEAVAPVEAAAPIEVAAPVEAEVARPVEAAAPVEAATAAGATQCAQLLLVEDNFVNQRVALYMLAKLRYQVEVVTTGVEALERLSKTRYQLILMDCQMPEMDGFEATRRIRDRTSAVLDHEVPIVAMTANAFPEDRVRAIASGMNDFLSKPVDQSTLSAVIEKWLRAPGRPAESPDQPADSKPVRAAATAS